MRANGNTGRKKEREREREGGGRGGREGERNGGREAGGAGQNSFQFNRRGREMVSLDVVISCLSSVFVSRLTTNAGNVADKKQTNFKIESSMTCRDSTSSNNNTDTLPADGYSSYCYSSDDSYTFTTTVARASQVFAITVLLLLCLAANSCMIYAVISTRHRGSMLSASSLLLINLATTDLLVSGDRGGGGGGVVPAEVAMEVEAPVVK